ncbi:unnamed protein product [Cuscuta campestris]|uniref:Ubiquitin carboxyl-terminal hydrolase n=1 Tax=Cuscuta campestris TaxID=132261 RepID=A0A484N8A1_9ASTE|nr:unnamed protein product [Cuscuta campestris]
METQSSETLEAPSRELSCPGSPNTRPGSPITSSGEVNVDSGSTPDSDNILDWDDQMEREVPQDERHSIVGGGFSNLGNTCFLNAVLQCFMHTVPVIEGLLGLHHPSPCDGYIKEFCMICALKELVGNLFASDGSTVFPWKLVNNLNYFSSSFQRYQQEDAHEFLQCFLDRLESCCKDTKQKESMPPQYVNLVTQTFGGRLVSKLRCCNCGHCSDTYEPLIDLSLEIEDANSIPAALESFTKVENIEDLETKFTCDNCKEQVLVEKQLLLDETPSVAAFHLKRFKNDGSVVEKIDRHVAFPLELDLLPYTAVKNQGSEGDSKYYLYAVLVHIGFSSCSGHYYCFIRAAPDVWYKFDDSQVTCVTEDYVMSQEAYILFYVKSGIPWFSDFIETQKLSIFKPVFNTSPKSVLENVDATTVPPRTCSNVADMASPTRFCEENHDNFKESKENVGPQMMSPPAFPVETRYSDASTSAEVEVMLSPSPLRERSRQYNGISKLRAYMTPKTPTRSPSPDDIYKDESPENVYSIPRGHLRVVDQSSGRKRDSQKEAEADEERKHALLLVKKTVRGSRGHQLMAALRGTQSESSVDKKRRRVIASPPLKEGSNSSNPFHKSRHPSGSSRPIIASGPR